MGDRCHSRHGPKRGGLLCPFRGSWDPVQYNVAWAEAYCRTKRRLHPPSHLATIDMGRKLGGSEVPLAEAYLYTKWHLDASSRLATIEMGRKLGGAPPTFWGGERGPHLTQSRLGRGLAPYQVTS